MKFHVVIPLGYDVIIPDESGLPWYDALNEALEAGKAYFEQIGWPSTLEVHTDQVKVDYRRSTRKGRKDQAKTDFRAKPETADDPTGPHNPADSANPANAANRARFRSTPPRPGTGTPPTMDQFIEMLLESERKRLL